MTTANANDIAKPLTDAQVEQTSLSNDLSKGAGEKSPLRAKDFFARLPHSLRVLESVCVFLGVNGIVAATIIVPPDLLFVPLSISAVSCCGVLLWLTRRR